MTVPFVEIPPQNLQHLPLFGYDKIGDDSDSRFAWYSSPRGRMRVEKQRPFVWVDDITDAMQLGAVSVVPNTQKPDLS